MYGTQHIGASTKQSEAAIGEEALRVILQYGQKKLVDRVNCVNLNPGAIGCCTINMRHSGEGNSFAYALRLLLEAGYKVDQANNQPF